MSDSLVDIPARTVELEIQEMKSRLAFLCEDLVQEAAAGWTHTCLWDNTDDWGGTSFGVIWEER